MWKIHQRTCLKTYEDACDIFFVVFFLLSLYQTVFCQNFDKNLFCTIKISDVMNYLFFSMISSHYTKKNLIIDIFVIMLQKSFIITSKIKLQVGQVPMSDSTYQMIYCALVYSWWSVYFPSSPSVKQVACYEDVSVSDKLTSNALINLPTTNACILRCKTLHRYLSN